MTVRRLHWGPVTVHTSRMLHRDTRHVRYIVTHRHVRDHRDMGPFTTKGHKLLELLAAVGQLVSVQSSSVDAWVTDPTNYIGAMAA